MKIIQLCKIAKMFGVNVETNPRRFEPRLPKGIVTMSAEGETVECVYFFPKANKMRLRKPGHAMIDGDFAEAICLALTRNESTNVNLCNTIRTLSLMIK